MDSWREVTLRVTVVLLVVSGLLIGPSLAGVGASVFLAAVLAFLGVGLVVARSDLEALPTVFGVDIGTYARDQWLACFLAGFALVWFSNASPAELQTLGGVAGFAGMANYFLRPLYAIVLSVVDPLIAPEES